MSKALLLGMLSVLLVTCTSSTAPLARETRLVASFDPDGRSVRCTLTNLSADTVFAAGCCAQALFYVDRQVGVRWERYSGGVCLGICPDTPEPVAPRDSAVGGVYLVDPGTYRLRVNVSSTWPGDSPTSIISAPFTRR
jgi:hypothetical protein